jgi:hypothetical protein
VLDEDPEPYIPVPTMHPLLGQVLQESRRQHVHAVLTLHVRVPYESGNDINEPHSVTDIKPIKT